jgi:hypothetical protein
MAGKPSFQFYPGDWLKDPALRGCEPSTRGIWLDLICFAWNAEDEGRVHGTVTRLARQCACTVEEMTAAISDLVETGTADVSRDGDHVTITCRRVARDLRDRDLHKQRQRRYKGRKSDDPSDDEMTVDATVKCEVEEEDEEREEREEVKTKTRTRISALRPDAPWQIEMYEKSTGRVPMASLWPSITNQVVRRDVWKTALDRAEDGGWKPDNVNARIKEYHDTDRTMYPKVNGKDTPARRSVDTESDAYLKAAGLIRI